MYHKVVFLFFLILSPLFGQGLEKALPDIARADSVICQNQNTYKSLHGLFAFQPADAVVVGEISYTHEVHSYIAPDGPGFIEIFTAMHGDTTWTKTYNKTGSATHRQTEWKMYVGGEYVQDVSPPEAYIREEYYSK